VKIPVDVINRSFYDYQKIKEVKTIGEHYNIYKDLFDSGFFYPVLSFNVIFGEKTNIWYGNKLNAHQVRQFERKI
jgi:hypothetical protein